MATLFLNVNNRLHQILRMLMSGREAWGRKSVKNRQNRRFKLVKRRFLGYKKFQVLKFARKINNLATTKLTREDYQMTDFLKFKYPVLAACLIAFAISLSVVGSASAQVRHGAVIAWHSPEHSKYYEPGFDFGLWVSLDQSTNAEALASMISDRCKKNGDVCKVLFTYTSCAAAFESSSDEIYVAATGDTEFDARSTAKKECKRLGGKNCKIHSQVCQHREYRTPQTLQVARYVGNNSLAAILLPSTPATAAQPSNSASVQSSPATGTQASTSAGVQATPTPQTWEGCGTIYQTAFCGAVGLTTPTTQASTTPKTQTWEGCGTIYQTAFCGVIELTTPTTQARTPPAAAAPAPPQEEEKTWTDVVKEVIDYKQDLERGLSEIEEMSETEIYERILNKDELLPGLGW